MAPDGAGVDFGWKLGGGRRRSSDVIGRVAGTVGYKLAMETENDRG